MWPQKLPLQKGPFQQSVPVSDFSKITLKYELIHLVHLLAKSDLVDDDDMQYIILKLEPN